MVDPAILAAAQYEYRTVDGRTPWAELEFSTQVMYYASARRVIETYLNDLAVQVKVNYDPLSPDELRGLNNG